MSALMSGLEEEAFPLPCLSPWPSLPPRWTRGPSLLQRIGSGVVVPLFGEVVLAFFLLVVIDGWQVIISKDVSIERVMPIVILHTSLSEQELVLLEGNAIVRDTDVFVGQANTLDGVL